MLLGKEVGLGPGHTVLDGDTVGTQNPTAAPPHFRPMPIVAKLTPISATAELLFCLLRLRRYKAKCVKIRCLQEGVGHLEPRFEGEGVVHPTNRCHSKGN